MEKEREKEREKEKERRVEERKTFEVQKVGKKGGERERGA